MAGSLDLGLNPDRLYVVLLESEPGRDDRMERRRIHESALSRVAELPVVEAAAVVRSVPFRNSIGVSLRAEGLDSISAVFIGGQYINAVTPGYFEALGLRIVRGRGFTERDVAGAGRATVIDETMARLLWPGDNPLGKCLYIDSGDDVPCTQVVGVAEDSRRQEVIERDQMMYYVPWAQVADNESLNRATGLLVRASTDAPAVQETLRREVHASAPDLRLVTVTPFSNYLAPQLRSWRLGATVFSAFGVLALIVAAVGLYSVLSFDVAQRRADFGVRAALGANAGPLVAWVIKDGVRFVAIGVALGAAGAFFAGRTIEHLLFETSSRDPLTFGLVTATLLGVGVVASLLPALRTTRVEPSEALKAD